MPSNSEVPPVATPEAMSGVGRDHPARRNGVARIIGISPAIRRAVSLVERLAATDLPILLVGATGTGKELFAEEIHRLSGRKGQLVAVNCGAIPSELVEGELFGYRRGAFTGAVSSHPGIIAQAAGGTLFLDELASLPPAAQVKILRVLETRLVRRVGDTMGRPLDFRVVGAVQEDVRTLLERKALRLDLLQRLAGVEITLPPLAARREDILPLAEHFAAGMDRRLDAEASLVLLGQAWMGNVRELRTTLERAALLTEENSLPVQVLEESIRLGSSPRSEGRAVAAAFSRERERLLHAIAEANGDPARAAAELAVSRSTLYRRLRVHRLSLSSGLDHR